MAILENLEIVREQINKAAKKAGRCPDEIKLIAVSKTKPMDMICEVASCGVIDFGENRPQELAEKFDKIQNVRWHLIGQLQKNKVKYIIDKAELIHSVDSSGLAEEIEKRAAKINKIQNILIQVNVSGEETKSGVAPEDAEGLIREISEMPHIRIKGLMTISVAGFSHDENKKIFAGLKELAEKIDRLQITNVSMEELSMGMTHDFEAAIEAGATMVRVGTGIFGTRN